MTISDATPAPTTATVAASASGIASELVLQPRPWLQLLLSRCRVCSSAMNPARTSPSGQVPMQIWRTRRVGRCIASVDPKYCWNLLGALSPSTPLEIYTAFFPIPSSSLPPSLAPSLALLNDTSVECSRINMVRYRMLQCRMPFGSRLDRTGLVA